MAINRADIEAIRRGQRPTPVANTQDITKINAATVRRKVNIFLVRRIGEMLCSSEPVELSGSQWSVPVWVATPERGMIQQIGTLLVDAKTGEVKVEQSDLEVLRTAARTVLLATGN